MRIVSTDFLRGRNLLGPGSGAKVALESIDPAERVDGMRLAEWLSCLPTTLRIGPVDLGGPLAEVVPRLLAALTESARLHAAPVKVLRRTPTALELWLPVDDRVAAEAAVALAGHALAAVRQGRPPDAATTRLWTALRATFWNQTHAHLARAAEQLGVAVHRLERGGTQLLQMGQGCRLRLFHETITDRTPLFARVASDKDALYRLLAPHAVPMPAQIPVDSLEQAVVAAERIGWPVVLKPATGSKGRGVWVGLPNADALERAWRSEAAGPPTRRLVQQTLTGADHRFLVVDGKLLAVAQRRPAELVSDGRRSLGDQIVAMNADPERGVAYERLLNRIPVDSRLVQLLAEQGLSLAAVPPAGTRVLLSRTANVSQGGTAIDCIARVHPDNRRLAEDVARLIGADVVGLDMMSRDTAVSWRSGGTWLLEANLSPGLRPHLVADPASDVCRRIVRHWMGDGTRSRIPTALVTGSIGKTTTSRMLAHVLLATGLRVGLTSSTGIEFDGHVIRSGDWAGGGPALCLLEDRRMEAVVAEVGRGGVIKSGLGIDRADVAAVLNVLDNHLGIDGIQSRDDLARVKGLVAGAAEKLLVVNADDPLTLAMAGARAPSSVALVSAEPGSSAWHAHRTAGFVAVAWQRGPEGRIELFERDRMELSVALREIPASENGAVGTIAPAAAFTVALARGLGIDTRRILEGLRGFGLAPGHRRGRFEPVTTAPWRIVLCWADGPQATASLAAYAAAATMAEPCRRVLLCSAPDNRPDAFLRDVGRATQGFDLVICAAWDERRGRSVHDVPRLLAEGVRSLGSTGPTVVVADAESEAVALLAERIRPGDFCVVNSFKSDAMRARLLETLA